MKRPLGWRREPARHALAAKGIKTGRKQVSKSLLLKEGGMAMKPYCAFIEWTGDQMPSVTTRMLAGDWLRAKSLAGAEQKIIEFLEKESPEWTVALSSSDGDMASAEAEAREKGKDPNMIVSIEDVAPLPYDPTEFSPREVVDNLVNEWGLEWEDAYAIHRALLTDKELAEEGYGPETLEAYGYDITPGAEVAKAQIRAEGGKVSDAFAVEGMDAGFVPNPDAEALSAAIDSLNKKGQRIKKPDWYVGDD